MSRTPLSPLSLAIHTALFVPSAQELLDIVNLEDAIEKSRTDFAVVADFGHEQYQTLRSDMNAEDAVAYFRSTIVSQACKRGDIKRVGVIVAQGTVAAEWTYGKGITYPPPPSDREVINVDG